MSELFSDRQIRDFYRAFNFADKNGVGSILASDLGLVMRRLGHLVTDEEAVALMEEISEEPNRISFSDFLLMMAIKMKESNVQEMVQEAFDVLDNNGDGLIRVEDLERSLTVLGNKLSPVEYQEMMEALGLGVGDQVSFRDIRKIIGDV